MPKTFYNILVPIDFSGRNKWAIAKAIELANNFHCNIHFVHVVSDDIIPFVPISSKGLKIFDNSAAMFNARTRLEEMRDNYREHLCNGNIEISVIEGNRREELAKYIDQYEMDLVVVGLAKFNLVHRILSSVSISSLAQRTAVPVLAIRSSGLISHFKKIVLPLTDEVPIRRIKLATMLARSFKSTVYLVSLRKDGGAGENILNKALEVVQSISTIPVQSFMLEGKNLAQSTLEFSKRINADLIMANPFKDFHMPGWWNRITNKLLSYGSNIPVMTVDKQNEKPPSPLKGE